MRSIGETHSRWRATFGSYEDIADLKRAVTANSGKTPCDLGLRSVCWKFCALAFLLFQNLNKSTWAKPLYDSRGDYTSLKEHFMKSLENSEDISADDPLDDSETSPWTLLRFDEELRAEIWQDVERCMPENSYFREPATQTMLLDILFIYCKLNRDIGYRQGMHEVLAPILWVVSCDAIDPSSVKKPHDPSEDIETLCLDSAFIEHDAFTMFGIIMQTVKTFYETGPITDPTSSLATFSPIVQRSKRIHEHLLHQTDPELAEHLAAIEILPQIFLIRWVRLIFGREFPFEDVLSLWDFLFAEDPELDLIDLVSVSMLLRIRWQLLEADYTAALTLLLRYPAPRAPHKAATFVSDALYLRDNLNLDGGDHIISKYSSRAPETTVTRKLPKKVKRARTAEQAAAQQAIEASQDAKTPRSKPRREQRGIDEIIQDTAKGLYTQGEKWGVTKALRGAVQGLQASQMSPRRSLDRSRWSIDGSQVVNERSHAELIKKVECLEERNRSLAKLLENAMNDLGVEQKATENENSAPNNSLSLAVAKVQFVQVYLENSSMQLPEDIGERNEQKNMTSPIPDSRSKSPNLGKEEKDVALDGTTDQSEPVHRSADDRSQQTPSQSHATVIPSTPPSKSTKSSQPREADLSPPRHLRPTLAQSPYSWMLGDEKPKSSFVSASPFANESNTSQGPSHARSESLFGEEQGHKSPGGRSPRAPKNKVNPNKELLVAEDIFTSGPRI